jgi:hypothetical protein
MGGEKPASVVLRFRSPERKGYSVPARRSADSKPAILVLSGGVALGAY